MRGQPKTRRLEEAWGMAACDGCGESLVLGEGFVRESGSGRRELLCADCAAEPDGLWKGPRECRDFSFTAEEPLERAA